MGYLFFAWVASFLYAFEVIISKIVSKYSLKNPWLFNFVWSFLIVIFTFPVALIEGISMPKDWFDLLLAGFLYALSGILFIITLYRLDVSILAPLFNVRSAMSVLLGVLFLNELISVEQALLIVIIFVTSIFVTLDERWSLRSFLRPAILLAILNALCLSLLGVFIKKSIAENGYWATTFFMPLISQIFLLLTIPKFTNSIRSINYRSFTVVSLIALAGTLGTFAANKAFAENVSISTVILSLPMSMIMVFLLSRFKPELLEKHTNKVYLVRFIAVGIMITAAVKLSVG